MARDKRSVVAFKQIVDYLALRVAQELETRIQHNSEPRLGRHPKEITKTGLKKLKKLVGLGGEDAQKKHRKRGRPRLSKRERVIRMLKEVKDIPIGELKRRGRKAMEDTCSEQGCQKPARAKGLCMAHYQKVRYHTKKVQKVQC